MFLAPEMGKSAFEVLREVAAKCEEITVAVGLPIWFQSSVFNAVALIVDNLKLLGIVCKQNLAGDGLHYEPRWFKPWPVDIVDTYETEGRRLGFQLVISVFDISGIRVGFEVCEDAWVAERPRFAVGTARSRSDFESQCEPF